MSWNNPPIKDKKSITLTPCSSAIKKSLAVPGSKSLTNRAFLLAAAAQGRSTLTNFLKAEDSHWCLDVLARLKVSFEHTDNGLVIDGTDTSWPTDKAKLFLGDAGTLARFLPSFLATGKRGLYQIEASEQLASRPIVPVLESLKELGCAITSETKNPYPYTIEGGHCKGGRTSITGKISSQFVSGLLLATPLAPEPVELIVEDELIQKDYVTMTLCLMQDFGVTVDAASDYSRFTVQPQRYQACNYNIEADASTASYFFAMAAATQGEITITNLKRDCLQPDIGFLNILEKLGCTITEDEGGIHLRAPQKLKGNQSFNMEAVSDTVPTLAAIAPFADGPIEITGVAHIRNHESDRISALYKTLTACKVPVEEKNDGLIIQPAMPEKATISSFNDHRIAMSMSVMGLAGSGIEIKNPGCVAKTCPIFFELLEELGLYKVSDKE